MNNHRVAVIGLGRMASTIDDEVRDYPAVVLPYSVAATCEASPRLTLVAGADILPEKRVAFAERWGVQALYDDYLRMIEQEAPDLVAICTRGALHAEMAVEVARAGVPMIYLEKAMACSMEEADAVLQACQEQATRLNTGVLRRFDSRYQQARQWIADGAIGDVRAGVHFAATNLLHGHIHSVDTLMYLMGDPRAAQVRGELRPRDLRFEENRLDRDPSAIYQIRFERGIEAYTIPIGQWDFEILGTRGSIRSMNNGVDWRLRQETHIGSRTFHAESDYPAPPRRSATLSCLEDLVDAHETGRPPLGDVEIAHHATEICFAVAQSHTQGGTWIDLPLGERELYIHHV